ncbi:MAG: phage holin family protein [Clostridia bacterium]|nr:phage holin family protein [Clostridia bacterium]
MESAYGAADLIRPELTALIPVLYLIGIGLKNSRSVKDKYIPLILGIAGALLCALWCLGAADIKSFGDAAAVVFSAVTQGVLAAGAGVYTNQLIKQARKEE